jgi:mRNA interferase RelE/StbE
LGVTRYRVELTASAVKALRHIDPPSRARIEGALALLAREPRPPGCKALRGRDGLRVRVGDYRIIYTVHDDVLRVIVVALGHRRHVDERR